MLDDQGKPEEALAIYRKSLDIKLKVFGPDHPDVAATFGNISSVYRTQGKYPEALEMQDKCLKICEKVLGRNPLAADTLYSMALGQHDLEAECFDKCVLIYAKVHGNAHSETADARKQAALAHNNIVRV